MNAEICCAVNVLSSTFTFQSEPMWRLTDLIVRSTFVTACRLAISPTRTSPFLANATTEGVVRDPSAFAITVGSPPSRTATTELVVPRSIPTARAIVTASEAGLSESGSSLTRLWFRASNELRLPGSSAGPTRQLGCPSDSGRSAGRGGERLGGQPTAQREQRQGHDHLEPGFQVTAWPTGRHQAGPPPQPVAGHHRPDHWAERDAHRIPGSKSRSCRGLARWARRDRGKLQSSGCRRLPHYAAHR